MWFNPSELKNTELNPTATFATSATYGFNIISIIKGESSESSNGEKIENLNPATLKVARVAKVATPQTVENDDRHYCRTCKNLSGKFCRARKEKVIDDVVRHCVDYSANGLEATAPATFATSATHKMIICGDCQYFKSHNARGGGGTCLVNAQSRLWAKTRRECQQFDPSIDWEALLTPKGAKK